jgi:hypothetical protein
MRNLTIILASAILACSSEKKTITTDDLFWSSQISVGRTASLKKLTDDSRSIYPAFAPGDSIVLFQRLLLTDPADTSYFLPEEMIRPFGINIESGQLYTLSSKYNYPSDRALEGPAEAPAGLEHVVWGIRSPDTNVLAFETLTGVANNVHTLYLAMGDSIAQLSYGATSCFLDRFSNTGRYLTATYGIGPTWVFVFDLKENRLYRIENDSDWVDYMTTFSSDDGMMVFLRSDRKYSLGDDFFGDIWLLKFDTSP